MCKTCGCGEKDKKHPQYGKGPKVSKSALDYLRTEALLSLSKGEGPGHPFRGNQYVDPTSEGKSGGMSRTGGGKGKSRGKVTRTTLTGSGMGDVSRSDIAGMTEDEYNMDELRASRDGHEANLEMEADLHGTGTQMYKDTKMLLKRANEELAAEDLISRTNPNSRKLKDSQSEKGKVHGRTVLGTIFRGDQYFDIIINGKGIGVSGGNSRPVRMNAQQLRDWASGKTNGPKNLPTDHRNL